MDIFAAMDINQIRSHFSPAIEQILQDCLITEEFVDKDRFRVYISTVWGNTVLAPQKAGIEEVDLSILHDYLNEEIQRLLGADETISSCFQYLVSKAGEESLARLQITQQHKAFIEYFSQLILGAEAGYKKD